MLIQLICCKHASEASVRRNLEVRREPDCHTAIHILRSRNKSLVWKFHECSNGPHNVSLLSEFAADGKSGAEQAFGTLDAWQVLPARPFVLAPRCGKALI